MSTFIDIENRAGLARITCGWKKAHLPLDAVRRYWRDVHGPAIARRAGVYEYRHSQFDPVRADLFAPVEGVGFACEPAEQLMWLSDVRYLDDEALAAFATSPKNDIKAHLLADIELLVDKSSTYKVVGERGRTYVDTTGDPMPQGKPPSPSFAMFFRQRSEEAGFRECMKAIAARWAESPYVLRVRLNLFEAPDIEAEKKAGYPIKTHPKEQQYQAWIDLVLANEAAAKTLFSADGGIDYRSHIREVHAYPVVALYTLVYERRPTLVGLRGYAAYESIQAFDAVGHTESSLLEWMYGPIVHGEAIERAAK